MHDSGTRIRMRTIRLIRLAAACSLLLLAAGVASAQSKTGTTIGQFLLIEPDARAAAMGNAGVTLFDGANAAYFNPAALGHMRSTNLQFSHVPWLAGITFNHAASAVRIGHFHTVLLAVTQLNSGEIDVRTEDHPHGTGERYTVQSMALGIGYGLSITDRFSAGLQVNYVRESIWHTSMNAFALNFGTLYQLPFGAYLGASVSNFGTQGRYSGRSLRIVFDRNPDRHGENSHLPAELHTESFSMPIVFRVGLEWPIQVAGSHQMALLVNAQHPSDNTENVSVGAEWTFLNAISIRGGYQHLFKQDSEEGLTLGVGLRQALYGYGLRFDYAWGEHGRLGNNQRFTMTLNFGE
jgi:long-subunit fatty acid transport protein